MTSSSRNGAARSFGRHAPPSTSRVRDRRSACTRARRWNTRRAQLDATPRPPSRSAPGSSAGSPPPAARRRSARPATSGSPGRGGEPTARTIRTRSAVRGRRSARRTCASVKREWSTSAPCFGSSRAVSRQFAELPSAAGHEHHAEARLAADHALVRLGRALEQGRPRSSSGRLRASLKEACPRPRPRRRMPAWIARWPAISANADASSDGGRKHHEACRWREPAGRGAHRLTVVDREHRRVRCRAPTARGRGIPRSCCRRSAPRRTGARAASLSRPRAIATMEAHLRRVPHAGSSPPSPSTATTSPPRAGAWRALNVVNRRTAAAPSAAASSSGMCATASCGAVMYSQPPSPVMPVTRVESGRQPKSPRRHGSAAIRTSRRSSRRPPALRPRAAPVRAERVDHADDLVSRHARIRVSPGSRPSFVIASLCRSQASARGSAPRPAPGSGTSRSTTSSGPPPRHLQCRTHLRHGTSVAPRAPSAAAPTDRARWWRPKIPGPRRRLSGQRRRRCRPARAGPRHRSSSPPKAGGDPRSNAKLVAPPPSLHPRLPSQLRHASDTPRSVMT